MDTAQVVGPPFKKILETRAVGIQINITVYFFPEREFKSVVCCVIITITRI